MASFLELNSVIYDVIAVAAPGKGAAELFVLQLYTGLRFQLEIKKFLLYSFISN
jgi:hypothetical protein